MKINRVLIGADDNPLYLPFLPIVSLAWQKLLGIKPTLAYVPSDGKIKDWMKEYCQDIVVYDIPKEIKRGSAATFCARLLIRAIWKEDICMVSDLDMIPLQKDIFLNLPKNFTKDNFLSIGYDAFKNGDGSPTDPAVKNSNFRKFPSCYTIATSNVWKEIINPRDLAENELLNSWHDHRDFDAQESPVKSHYFCDESLMRALVQKWNPSRDRVIGVDRGANLGVMDGRIDRANWQVDKKKLEAGNFVDAHCPRPFSQYRDSLKLITDFLKIPFVEI